MLLNLVYTRPPSSDQKYGIPGTDYSGGAPSLKRHMCCGTVSFTVPDGVAPLRLHQFIVDITSKNKKVVGVVVVGVGVDDVYTQWLYLI